MSGDIVSFIEERASLVDDVFAWRGQPCRVFVGTMAETITGIYRDPVFDAIAGEISVASNAPILRFKTGDIAGLQVARGTQIEADGKMYEVTTRDDDDDGTTYLDLKAVPNGN